MRNPIRLLKPVVLLFALGVAAGQDEGAADSVVAAASGNTVETGYPVLLNEDTVFLVKVGTASFTAQERAAIISSRLRDLADDTTLIPDSVRARKTSGMTVVSHRDRILFRVTPEDAAGGDRDSLANAWLTTTVEAVTGKRAEARLWDFLARAAGVVGILLLSLLVEWVMIRLARRARRGIGGLAAKGRLPTFRIQKVTLLAPQRVQDILLKVFNALAAGAHILVGYASLLLIFFVFPWTRSWGHAVLSATLSPFASAFWGFVAFLPDLLHIIIIVGLAHLFLRLVRRLSNEVENGNLTIPGFYTDWARPTFNIFRFLFYAFVLVIIFPYLPGSDSPVFKGVTVFLGIMVSLGSSSAFSNIVAGIVMTYMRSFRIGDRIQVGDMVGDVEEKTMLVTRIRTFHGETVTMPNAALLAGNTVNYTMAAEGVDQRLRLHTQVTIGYDVPWRQVHALLLKAAAVTEGVLKEPEAFVLQKALDDFYVAYELNVHTRDPRRMNFIYSDLHQNIQDAFFAAGVEIMSPHYRAMRDGSTAAIPPEFRPARAGNGKAGQDGKMGEGTP